jgi:hypothetical protein
VTPQKETVMWYGCCRFGQNYSLFGVFLSGSGKWQWRKTIYRLLYGARFDETPSSDLIKRITQPWYFPLSDLGKVGFPDSFFPNTLGIPPFLNLSSQSIGEGGKKDLGRFPTSSLAVSGTTKNGR